MRRLSLVLLFFGLMAAPFVGAQGAASGDGHRVQADSTKGVSLPGDVSKDGKTLVADDDNVWNVSNADVLHGFEGRHVTVKCRMDPGHHSILVIYVVEPYKSSPYLRDSAFRR